MELIKITEHNGKSAVSARDLYDFLGFNKSQWKRWYTKNVINNQFAIENEDYQGFDIESNGNVTQEFALSIDFAKKISMMARTEKGEQARQYFIECENNLKQLVSKPRSHKEVILAELRLLEENEKLQRENGRLHERTQFVDVVFKSDDLLTISQASKALNLEYGRNTLCKKLREIGIFFKNSNEPKQEYLKRGYFRVKEKIIGERSSGEAIITMQTYVTQKGLGFLSKQLGIVIPSIKLVKVHA